MDLETENRLASLLMEEARRLRVETEKEGIHVYLKRPNVRGRPNSRFLTATVLGVQQANRAVEVGEMCRAREKELELEAKLKSRAKVEQKHHNHVHCLRVSSSSRDVEACRNSATQISSSKRVYDDCYSRKDDGLRDEEVEEFLQSRVKRGRGAIGSRMDETGPFMASTSSDRSEQYLIGGSDTRVKEDWECRVLGPEKPPFLKFHDEPHCVKECCTIKGLSKHRHRSKERRSKGDKEKRKDKGSKHHHRKSRTRD